MNDLISREALSEVINDLFRIGEYDCNSVLKAINNAPTVEKRPTGDWIITGEEDEVYAEMFICSECGVKDFWSNFCPNCGADMIKEGRK